MPRALQPGRRRRPGPTGPGRARRRGTRARPASPHTTSVGAEIPASVPVVSAAAQRLAGAGVALGVADQERPRTRAHDLGGAARNSSANHMLSMASASGAEPLAAGRARRGRARCSRNGAG